MNELQLVRGVYDDPPPPSAEAAADARTRMLSQDDDTARPPSRRTWRMPLGLVAAATAAAVAAGMTLAHDPARPPAGVQAVPHTLSPRDMMLAAASQAELEQQGRYWYAHQRKAFMALALGSTGGYVVEERREALYWTGRARGDGQSFYGRSVAGKPHTSADADAWRAAGSPSSWKVRSSGLTRTVRSKSGAWQEDQPNDKGGGTFNIGGVGQFTYQELQELPTDPEELRKLLCEGSVKFITGRSGAPRRCNGPVGVLSRVYFALVDTPVPPKVRAGLMRLITDYPGVRQLGAVTDPLGRSAVGLAVTFDSADDRGKIQRDLLFDPKTGKVLGSRDIQLEPGPKSQKWQVPGRTLNYRAVLDTGWSNTKPTPPD